MKFNFSVTYDGRAVLTVELSEFILSNVNETIFFNTLPSSVDAIADGSVDGGVSNNCDDVDTGNELKQFEAGMVIIVVGVN